MPDPVQTDRTVADVPCPFCACLCDDLEVAVAAERIVAVTNACERARPQFLKAGAGDHAVCRVDGTAASLDEAVCRAAEILLSARYPLIWGLGRATCEAQAAAVEIAERLGGVLDVSGGEECADGELEALQTIGEVTCSLGEIRSRADLVVVWNADPLTAQPRFFERHAPPSLAQPDGCPLIVIDSKLTSTASAASEHLQILASSDFESATVLRALASGAAIEPASVARQTGLSIERWKVLLSSMEQARYGVLLYATSGMSSACPSALHSLIRTLNDRTRWVCLRLGGVSNAAGAEQAFTWRTGFPRSIDFSHGFPRFNPTDFVAGRLLERGEVDAALLVCCDPQFDLSSAARSRLRSIPTVVVDWKEPPGWPQADVEIRVAVPGVESGGTMFRLDGVPLALRPALPPKCPADFALLRMLQTAITSSNAGNTTR